jgi:hypothetical protein
MASWRFRAFWQIGMSQVLACAYYADHHSSSRISALFFSWAAMMGPLTKAELKLSCYGSHDGHFINAIYKQWI